MQQHIEALAIVEATLGLGHPEAAATLLDIAQIELDLGRPTDALDHVHGAFTVLDTIAVSNAFVASGQFIRAQAQWDSGGEQASATEQATRARSQYAQYGQTFAEEVAEIDDWLSKHR